MATQVFTGGDIFSAVATGDLSSYQHHCLMFSTGTYKNGVALNDGSAPIIGVLQDKPSAAGQSAEVGPLTPGRTGKVVADGSGVNIAREDYLTSDASGHAIKTTTNLEPVLGIALEACTTAGAIIEYMALGPYATYPAAS